MIFLQKIGHNLCTKSCQIPAGKTISNLHSGNHVVYLWLTLWRVPHWRKRILRTRPFSTPRQPRECLALCAVRRTGRRLKFINKKSNFILFYKEILCRACVSLCLVMYESRQGSAFWVKLCHEFLHLILSRFSSWIQILMKTCVGFFKKNLACFIFVSFQKSASTSHHSSINLQTCKTQKLRVVTGLAKYDFTNLHR